MSTPSKNMGPPTGPAQAATGPHPATAHAPPGEGRLAENILHFSRALRRAGLRIGPARTLAAIEAVAAAGFDRREDFRTALAATLVSRPEDLATFERMFDLFWRDPQFLEKMMSLLLPSIRGGSEARTPKEAERRAAEALLGEAPPPESPREAESEEVEIEARLSFSAAEAIRSQDFEQMSAEEIREAERAIAALSLPARPIHSRRSRPSPQGRLPDWRRTMRHAFCRGGEIDRLHWRRPAERWPDLVALLDISGSMASYSRMMLHFLHACAHARNRRWGRVHAFTFGTGLTNVTRPLMHKDPDAALAAIGTTASDWEGGTRIAPALARFNRDWSRRVLARGAIVLLVTDGLDRAGDGRLDFEMERLHLSARHLIWLNPLLRWEGFSPEAAGIRAMLPHVDSLRACHNVESLAALAEALAREEDTGDKARILARVRPEDEEPGRYAFPSALSGM